jgi:hypothetical protein
MKMSEQLGYLSFFDPIKEAHPDQDSEAAEATDNLKMK